jgi:hypothetical protein
MFRHSNSRFRSVKTQTGAGSAFIPSKNPLIHLLQFTHRNYLNRVLFCSRGLCPHRPLSSLIPLKKIPLWSAPALPVGMFRHSISRFRSVKTQTGAGSAFIPSKNLLIHLLQFTHSNYLNRVLFCSRGLCPHRPLSSLIPLKKFRFGLRLPCQ